MYISFLGKALSQDAVQRFALTLQNGNQKSCTQMELKRGDVTLAAFIEFSLLYGHYLT